MVCHSLTLTVSFYLQINLNITTRVTSVLVQSGVGGGEAYVQRFHLHYSGDGVYWMPYTEADTDTPQVCAA